MQWAHKYKQRGFTIVELLIVVVVIAILAAIITVAYNGVTQRAKESAAQSAVQTVVQKIMAYAVESGGEPPVSLSALGISDAGGVEYQYMANTTSPAGYCVTANSGNISFFAGNAFMYTGSSSGTVNQTNPTNGACPGHGTGGTKAVRNYSMNPSIEIGKNFLEGPNSSTVTRDTTRAYQGGASVLVTMPAGKSSTTVGTSFFQEIPFTTLKPNTTYVASAYVWVPPETGTIRLSIQGDGRNGMAENTTQSYTSLKSQWVRLKNKFSTDDAGTITTYLLNNDATPATPTQFWADGFMLTEGEQLFPYSDGNSANWIWLGAPGLSQSIGPQ